MLTEENVNANKGNGGLLRGQVGRAGDGSSDSHDELAYTHADGTHKKEAAATHRFNEVQTREGGYNVDAATVVSSRAKLPSNGGMHLLGDDRNNERVLKAGVLEVLGTVVEDEVDTG